MNRVLVWPARIGPQRRVGVAQADRGLAGVAADAEHVELELHLVVAGRPSRRRRARRARDWRTLKIVWPSLPNWPSVVGMREGRRVGVPVGIDAVEVLDRVDLGEAVDLEMVDVGVRARPGG